jgi:hypothetical protein
MNGPLHFIPPLEPFETWGIDLMGPLPMTRRGHKIIIIIIDYLKKFAKICALKLSTKQKGTQFLYERVFTRFATRIEIVSNISP